LCDRLASKRRVKLTFQMSSGTRWRIADGGVPGKLSTTTEDIRRFADALTQVAAHGRVVVLGSEQAIQAANAERQGSLSVSKVI
jgi:hypothetical protein